jgi:polar amino acid transport system permease protein
MAEFLWQSLPHLLFGFPDQRPGGLLLSLLLSAGAMACGLALALLFGLAGASSWRSLRVFSGAYVYFFRGLPLLLLLLLVHQGSAYLGWYFSPLGSAFIALSLYSGAYQTEVVRSGLLALPPELLDSARSLGAGPWQCFWRVRLPFTFHHFMPGFINEAITVFKDSSVVLVLGVGDLMTVARMSLGSDVKNTAYWLPLYLLVGLLYALIALGISRLGVWWEKTQGPARSTITTMIHTG